MGTPGGHEKLGAAVAATNLEAGFSTERVKVSSGDEVILGAPGVEGGSPGAVLLYRTFLSDSDKGGDRLWWRWDHYATITGPSTASRFGEAIAVWPNETPFATEWFAVGAPGAEVVQILGKAGGSPPTYAVLQTISASGVGIAAGSDFGAAITVEDFDQDGLMDLAIGAPGADTVVVVRGSGGSTPLDAGSVLTVSSPLGAAASFGAALAAGEIYGSGRSPVGLVVGAPTLANGAVCTIGINSSFALLEPESLSTTPACGYSPYVGTKSHGFGAAVAVGNVAPRDLYGRHDTTAAYVEEVIVAAPGADESEWFGGTAGYSATSLAASVGQVAVLQSRDRLGPVLPPGSTLSVGELPRTDLALQPSTGAQDSQFGASVWVEDIQSTDHHDIVVGAPGWSPTGANEFGAVQLLNSDVVNGLDEATGGVFLGIDSADARHEIAVLSHSGTTHLAGAGLTIRYEKPDGKVCKAYATKAEAIFKLDFSLPHELGEGTTSEFAQLIVDGRSGDLLGEVPPTGSFKTAEIFRFDLAIEDANFDVDSRTDEIRITFSNVDIHTGGSLGFIPVEGSKSLPMLGKDCAIKNGPTFTLTRDSDLDPTCD